MRKSKLRSDRRTLFGIQANGPVFIASLSVVAILVVVTLVVGKPMETWFVNTQRNISNAAGWFFILVVNSLLLFSVYLGFGKFGKIRIGGQDAVPEFSRIGWFAMLFSAGMGIGLLFWGVAEPIRHFNSNPFTSMSEDPVIAAKNAMGLTFLHWGVHTWALYAVVGVSLAYFTFNKKLPLTIRSIFHPLIGNRIYGPIGDVIDTISVIATIFGLATSLGFGAQQVNAGLHYLFGMNISTTLQVLIIVVITFMATLSLVLGLKKGIKVLSIWNMRFALLLLVFLLIVGPSIFLLKSFVQNIGTYLNDFFELSFWANTYNGSLKNQNWQNSWTIFYWAWWISWSPFVGIFIARISYGRTIREFVLGVLLVPTTLTFLWLSVFGGSALYQELNGNHVISEMVNKNVATAIYYMLEQYPLATLSSILTVILVASFFITSSDSGSFVVDTLTSGGRHSAPKGQKIFWASIEGLVAAILLIGGGLTALQTASILSGLPFAIIIVIMCVSFYKELKEHK